MKQLVFIDNESEKVSNVNWGDLDRVKDLLEAVGIFQQFENKITSIYNFGNLEKDQAYDILFNKENVICTWSVYSAGFPYSLQQLISFLSAASRNEISNMIYIDCSGMIVETLNRQLKDVKNLYHCLNAIETNYILTKDGHNQLKRVRIKFKGAYKDCIELEDFNFSNISE